MSIKSTNHGIITPSNRPLSHHPLSLKQAVAWRVDDTCEGCTHIFEWRCKDSESWRWWVVVTNAS